MIKRIDILLAEKGLAKSRTAAAAFIKEGRVSVCGRKVAKNSELFEEDCEIEISYPETLYVSRGGIKLQAALENFGANVKGLVCLDIGASTGGFTQCLLINGASKVYAVDSGSGQLDDSLRADVRVESRENVNARYLKKSDFAEKIDLIVMDVSFISQTLIYPAASDILETGGKMITLVKPQFESDTRIRRKNGVVKDKDGSNTARVMEKIAAAARANGFRTVGTVRSPIEGGDGNEEYLAEFIRE